jgi:hypothetical protein
MIKSVLGGHPQLNGDSGSMRILLVLPMIALTGCLASRMQSMQSQGNDSSSSRGAEEITRFAESIDQNVAEASLLP